MYNILIVDDEPLILAGIISMINWEDYNCRIIGKASNGKQALEKIKELDVDMVITDINMPVMNGIEMIQEMIEVGLDATYILLTNLEDFNLVKKAMSLGVIDYLVKLELTEEILSETVKKAIEKCKKNRIIKNYNSENQTSRQSKYDYTLNFFEEIINNNKSVELKYTPNYILNEYKDLLIISVSLNYDYDTIIEDFDIVDKKRIISYLVNVLNEIVRRFFKRNCIIKGDDNTLMIIVSTYEVDNYIVSVTNMSEKIITVLNDYFGVSILIAISNKANSIADIEILKKQIINIIDYSFNNKALGIVFYNEDYIDYDEKKISLSSFKRNITLSLKQNNAAMFIENINKFIDILKKNKLSKTQGVEFCKKILNYIISAYEDEVDKNINYFENFMDKINFMFTIHDITQFLLYISEEVVKYIDKKKVNKSEKIIELVKAYVEENYKEKICLNKVSEDLNISTGYLSSIFKTSTGNNFSDYVSEVKIEKAKELIRTRYYMMYEISDMLGYNNPYYFSKVFKKVTGYTPKEYEVLTLEKSVE